MSSSSSTNNQHANCKAAAAPAHVPTLQIISVQIPFPKAEERISQILLRFSLCKKVSPLQIFWPGRSSSNSPPRPSDRPHAKSVTQKGEGGSNKKKVQLDPASFYFPFCLDPTSGKKKGEAGKLQVRLSPYIRMERPEGLITLPPSLQPSLLRDDAQ